MSVGSAQGGGYLDLAVEKVLLAWGLAVEGKEVLVVMVGILESVKRILIVCLESMLLWWTHVVTDLIALRGIHLDWAVLKE